MRRWAKRCNTSACRRCLVKRRVVSLRVTRSCLDLTVYQSFESDAVAKSGDVPMPGPSEKIMGGHAVVAVGYDDSTQRFIVRNSWGPG